MGKLSRCSSRPSSDRRYRHESACRPRQSVFRPAHSLSSVRIRDGHSGRCCPWSVAFFAECTSTPLIGFHPKTKLDHEAQLPDCVQLTGIWHLCRTEVLYLILD